MKINKTRIANNLSCDDGRVGWKYPLNYKEISKACDRFFSKRCMKKKTFMPVFDKK